MMQTGNYPLINNLYDISISRHLADDIVKFAREKPLNSYDEVREVIRIIRERNPQSTNPHSKNLFLND